MRMLAVLFDSLGPPSSRCSYKKWRIRLQRHHTVGVDAEFQAAADHAITNFSAAATFCLETRKMKIHPMPRFLRRRLVTGSLAALLFAVASSNRAFADDQGEAKARPPGTYSSTPNAPSKPAYGGSLTLSDVQLIYTWQLQAAGRYNIGTVLNQIVDRLVDQDPKTGEFVPWIATSYVINETATEFTFTIRDGVTFSDGTPLDVNAVKANLDQYGNGDDAKNIPKNADFIGYDRTEIIDDHTLRVYLSKPNRYFIVALAVPQAGLVSLSTLGKTFKEQSKPENLIGSGPFVFQHEVPNQEVTLIRREDYKWPPHGARNRSKAYLEKVTFREIAEPGLRTGALLTGQVDVAKGIQPSDEQQLQDQGFNIYGQKPLLNVVDQISIRVENKLVSDRNVRYALSIGFDRRELVDTVLSKSYEPTTALFVEGTPGRVAFDRELAYDPAKANRLLDEAGWIRNAHGVREKDGEPLKLSMAASSQSSAVKPATEFIAQQWRQLGVVLINRAGDDTFMNQYAQSSENPVRIFRPGLSSGLVGIFGYPNGLAANNTTTLHSNPELEELFQEDLRATDRERQNAILARIQKKLIVDDVYTIPVYAASQTYGASNRVHIFFNSNTLPALQETWIEPK